MGSGFILVPIDLTAHALISLTKRTFGRHLPEGYGDLRIYSADDTATVLQGLNGLEASLSPPLNPSEKIWRCFRCGTRHIVHVESGSRRGFMRQCLSCRFREIVWDDDLDG